MGRIVVTEFVSLEGVMEDPGGSERFMHGFWTFEIDRGEGAKFRLEETMATDALLLGRVTYEGFAEAWPSRDGEFADKFNSMPKHVVSSTLERPAWNATVLEGDLASGVAKLKEQYDGDVVVHGSAQLVQALLADDLVDELRLMVFPRGARQRQAPLRRDRRQEASPTRRDEDGRRGRAHPHVRAAPGRRGVELEGSTRGRGSRSPPTDSNRRPPPYHQGSGATGRNPWQRIWLDFGVFAAVAFAAGCD
jgi:dihydrofolate reductase